MPRALSVKMATDSKKQNCSKLPQHPTALPGPVKQLSNRQRDQGPHSEEEERPCRDRRLIGLFLESGEKPQKQGRASSSPFYCLVRVCTEEAPRPSELMSLSDAGWEF